MSIYFVQYIFLSILLSCYFVEIIVKQPCINIKRLTAEEITKHVSLQSLKRKRGEEGERLSMLIKILYETYFNIKINCDGPRPAPCPTVTKLPSTPEFKHTMDRCCQTRVFKLETLDSITFTMDYLRMDGKQGHVKCYQLTARNHFKKFASFEEQLLLCLSLLGPYNISHGLIWGK